MKKSLNRKFVRILAVILVVLFLVLLIAVQILSLGITDAYIKNDVLAGHERMNDRLCAVLDEINYGYTRMTQCPQALLLESGDRAKREAAFAQMLSDAALSEDYVNVVLILGQEVYTRQAGFDLPASSFIHKVAGGERILWLGEVNPEQDYLAIGRRFQLHGMSGVVVFYVKGAVFTEICQETDPAIGFSELITDGYRILAKSVGDDMGKTILEQENYPLTDSGYFQRRINGVRSNVVVTRAGGRYAPGWYFVSVLDNGALTRDFALLSWALVAIAVISLLVAIVLSWRLSRKITSPINELSAEISAVDFTTGRGIGKFAEEGDELYALWQNYDLMVKRLFRLMDENIQSLEVQRKLELDALQSQINPHFLYNTLDAIAWIAKLKKQPEIEVLVINLAKFFRLSLHKGDKYITIAEEVELVEHFLEIEKIRFPDTLTYECSIDPEIRDCRILKLVLQPIVENCIKHGFVPRDGVGHIRISARPDGEDILLAVADNGCGFQVPAELFTGETDGKAGGYGLRNVNKRIQLEYGREYGMSITSQCGVGTCVTVRIRRSR